MKRFRQIIFWLHLAAGIVAGIVIAIMSFTGAALAFEKEIIRRAERDAAHLSGTPIDSNDKMNHQPLDTLIAHVREARPGQRPTAVTLYNNPNATVLVAFGRTNSVYVDPYKGELREPQSARTRAFLRTMNDWHRYLGRQGDTRARGKAITGACNAAFLVLAVSGLYLWWPRNWRMANWGAITLMRFRIKGRARDWNWHNAVGFWTAPVLIVLTLTAMPISYRWATNLIYTLTRSEVPAQGGRGGSPPPEVTVEPGTVPLKLDALVARAKTEVPNWKEITVRLGGESRGGSAPRGGGRRQGSHAVNSASTTQRALEFDSSQVKSRPATVLAVKEKGGWPLFSSIQLTMHPFTGDVMRCERFSDYNLGRQVRSWTRFLHTGEALGKPGQAIAGLASLVSLLLVWTGFALAWRRFFGKKQPPT